MGAVFNIQNVSGVQPLDYNDYPVLGSLKDLFYLGTDAASSTTNQATGLGIAGRSNATVLGTVTHNAGYASFAGAPASNQIQLGANENEFTSWTRWAFFRFNDAIGTGTNDWRGVFGSYASTSRAMIFGHLMTFGYGTSPPIQVAIGIPPPPHSEFHFVAVSYDAPTKTFRTYYGRNGVLYLASTVTHGTGWVGAAVPMLIGGNGSIGTNNRTVDVNSVGSHNAVENLAAIESVYIFRRARAIEAGLPVS